MLYLWRCMNKALYLITEIHAFGSIQDVYSTWLTKTLYLKNCLVMYNQLKMIFPLYTCMTTYKAVIILHEQSMNKIGLHVIQNHPLHATYTWPCKSNNPELFTKYCSWLNSESSTIWTEEMHTWYIWYHLHWSHSQKQYSKRLFYNINQFGGYFSKI